MFLICVAVKKMGEIFAIESLAHSNKLPFTRLLTQELFCDYLYRESPKSYIIHLYGEEIHKEI